MCPRRAPRPPSSCRLIGGDARRRRRRARVGLDHRTIPSVLVAAAALLTSDHALPRPRRRPGQSPVRERQLVVLARRPPARRRRSVRRASSATTWPNTPTTCWRPGSPADPSRTRSPEHHRTRSKPMSQLTSRTPPAPPIDAHPRSLDGLVRRLPTRRPRRDDPHRTRRQSWPPRSAAGSSPAPFSAPSRPGRCGSTAAPQRPGCSPRLSASPPV